MPFFWRVLFVWLMLCYGQVGCDQAGAALRKVQLWTAWIFALEPFGGWFGSAYSPLAPGGGFTRWSFCLCCSSRSTTVLDRHPDKAPGTNLPSVDKALGAGAPALRVGTAWNSRSDPALPLLLPLSKQNQMQSARVCAARALPETKRSSNICVGLLLFPSRR